MSHDDRQKLKLQQRIRKLAGNWTPWSGRFSPRTIVETS